MSTLSLLDHRRVSTPIWSSCFHADRAHQSALYFGGYSPSLVLLRGRSDRALYLAVATNSVSSLDHTLSNCTFRMFTRKLPLFFRRSSCRVLSHQVSVRYRHHKCDTFAPLCVVRTRQTSRRLPGSVRFPLFKALRFSTRFA